MEIYQFFRTVLVLTVTVTALWPLNVPLIALAYRVRNGTSPLPLETDAFCFRSLFAALALAALAVSLTLVDFFLANPEAVGLPPGIVHLMIWSAFLVLAVPTLYHLYALDDYFQAAGVFLLYVGMPGAVLFLLSRIGFRWPLSVAESWLAPIT